MTFSLRILNVVSRLGRGVSKYSFAISPISFDASPRGCVGGNVMACGRFSIPSLIGLSPSVISLAVAFCVSVIGF